MYSRHQLRQYKEIVDRHLPKSDPNYIDVEKEFKETWVRVAAVSKDANPNARRKARGTFANAHIEGVPLQ